MFRGLLLFSHHANLRYPRYVFCKCYLFHGTCQSFKTINILCKVFEQLFLFLENFQEIVRSVWKVVGSGIKFFCPTIERSRVGSVLRWLNSNDLLINKTYLKYSSSKIASGYGRLYFWRLAYMPVLGDLKSGMPLAVLSPAPAITTILWALSNTWAILSTSWFIFSTLPRKWPRFLTCILGILLKCLIDNIL